MLGMGFGACGGFLVGAGSQNGRPAGSCSFSNELLHFSIRDPSRNVYVRKSMK